MAEEQFRFDLAVRPPHDISACPPQSLVMSPTRGVGERHFRECSGGILYWINEFMPAGAVLFCLECDLPHRLEEMRLIEYAMTEITQFTQHRRCPFCHGFVTINNQFGYERHTCMLCGQASNKIVGHWQFVHEAIVPGADMRYFDLARVKEVKK